MRYLILNYCSPPKPSRTVQMVGKLNLHIPVSRSNSSPPSTNINTRNWFPGPSMTAKSSPLVQKPGSIEFTKHSPQHPNEASKCSTTPPPPTLYSSPTASLEQESERIAFHTAAKQLPLATGRYPSFIAEFMPLCDDAV